MKTLRRIKYPKLDAVGGSREHGDDRARWWCQREDYLKQIRELLDVKSGCICCLLGKIGVKNGD